MAQNTTVPDWMTKQFFVDAIAKKFALPENGFTIGELKVCPATEAGDNYASVLYRVQVPVEISGSQGVTVVSLIVKTLPQFGASDELFQQMNLFPKEMEMYGKVLPDLERMYHQRGRTDVVFGPRCLKHGTEPTTVIVMEDMRDCNYRMANRCEGMDLDHIRIVLRRLAQFHAASATYYGPRGPSDAKMMEGMFSEKGRAMHEQIHMLQETFLHKVLGGWSEKSKFVADIMLHWGMDMYDVGLHKTRAKPGRFNVLNHGDLWCNNVLFHYDSNSSIDKLALIDYQLCSWASPAIDLLYFIITSVREDLRLSQMDYMIRYYHEQLVDSLHFLEYPSPVPTLKELHTDVIEHHLFGFLIALSILPVCLMKKSDDASMDLMMDPGEAGVAFKLKIYNDPVYVRQMEQLMDYFLNMGVFDILQLGTQQTARVECDPTIQLPVWLDREFVEYIVRQKFDDAADERRIVRGAYVKKATKKTGGYEATLYSLKVDLFRDSTATEETLSLIIKAPAKGNQTAYLLDREKYVRERYIYESILPALEELYRAKGKPVKLGAQYYAPPSGLPVEVIVLEDLAIAGYRMAPRQEGLDRAHTEAVLEQLAKFHAASAVYCETNPSSPPVDLKRVAYTTKMDELSRPTLEGLFELLKNGWDFAEEYAKDFELAASRSHQLIVDLWTVDGERFTVLNHGHAWVNNMLFAYEDDHTTVARVALLDYRYSAWGSPVFDLIQFLFSSVHPTLKLSEQGGFLRFYQEKLVENLRLLGYRKPMPTLQRLHMDFSERIPAAIKATVIDLPHVLVGLEDDASVEAPGAQSGPSQGIIKPPLFDNVRYTEQMKVLLPYFRNRGAFTHDVTITNQIG